MSEEVVVVDSQCNARVISGRQCRMKRIDGEDFCLIHVDDPRILKRAQTTLNGLSIMAVSVIEKALTESENKCALCGSGYITPTKLKAAGMVLDRTGIGPTLKIQHSGDVNFNLIVDRMTDDEFKLVDEIMQRVMARVEHDTALETGVKK